MREKRASRATFARLYIYKSIYQHCARPYQIINESDRANYATRAHRVIIPPRRVRAVRRSYTARILAHHRASAAIKISIYIITSDDKCATLSPLSIAAVSAAYREKKIKMEFPIF